MKNIRIALSHRKVMVGKVMLGMTALLCVVSAAQASSFFGSADCDGGCDNPPVAVNPSGQAFSIDVAQGAFQNGVAPTIDELAGNWINIGVVAVPGNPDPSVKNTYDTSGLKNQDGSPQISLQIQKGVNTGQTDFTGNPILTPDSVTLLGLGTQDHNQGPNEITFDTRKNEACFAQYAYNSNDGSLAKSHFNFECRLLASDSNKMICSTTYIADPSESQAPEDQAWNGKVASYSAFVK